MKITQIMLSKGFGGAERYFVDLSIALQRRGHEVQVICHPQFSGRKTLENTGKIKSCFFPVMGWWDIYHQRKIRNSLKQFSPDIVHAHLARGAYVAGRACHIMKLPLVVKTHNYVNLKYYSHVDHFIATTADQKNYLMQKHVRESAITVIPNFSSVPVKKVSGFKSNRLRIAAYGRLVRKKGMHVLLQSFCRFLDEGIEATLDIGGDGPEIGKLEALVDELEIRHSVKFHGWINNVAEFISRCDVMVLPSLNEPFGIVVLEIMARGKPLIATRTAGPMEVLDENCAYLVDAGDETGLFKAMKRVAANPEEAAARAEAAQQLYVERYSEQAIVPDIVETYQGLINSFAADHPVAGG